MWKLPLSMKKLWLLYPFILSVSFYSSNVERHFVLNVSSCSIPVKFVRSWLQFSLVSAPILKFLVFTLSFLTKKSANINLIYISDVFSKCIIQ